MKTLQLTENQRYYLKHIAKHGMTSEHGIARQLQKKGLIVIDFDKYERVEWNKVIARLTVATLTSDGQRVLKSLREECTCES